MTTPTRRSVLGGGAVLPSSLSGCTGFTAERRTETSAVRHGSDRRTVETSDCP